MDTQTDKWTNGQQPNLYEKYLGNQNLIHYCKFYYLELFLMIKFFLYKFKKRNMILNMQ